MNRIWIVSDTHYGHGNIVKGVSTWQDTHACRDFSTLEEHDNTVVKNINDCVDKDDYLYHLGDWSFGGREKVAEFRNRIKCKNVIITFGNHDVHIAGNHILKYKNRFVNAQDLFNGCYTILEKKWQQQRYVLCHYPIHSWHKIGKAIHLYGHTHKELNYHPMAVCMSMECHPEFRPFNLDEILNIVNERKKDFPNWKEWIARDNHGRILEQPDESGV